MTSTEKKPKFTGCGMTYSQMLADLNSPSSNRKDSSEKESEKKSTEKSKEDNTIEVTFFKNSQKK